MLLPLPEYQLMTLADVLVNGTVYRQAVSEASVMPVTGVSSRLSCATGKTVKVITDGSTPLLITNMVKTRLPVKMESNL